MRALLPCLVSLLVASSLGCRQQEAEGEPPAERQAQAQGSPSPATSPDARARRMLALLNQARQERGLGALAWSEDLAAVAEAHSRDMLARSYFAHVDPEGDALAARVRAAGLRYRMIGENLGLAPDVERAHQTLMQSPSHRENMLNPAFEEAGIGLVEVPEGQAFEPTHRDETLPLPPGGLSGYLIVTQVFRR